MNRILRYLFCVTLIWTFLSNALPCGPGYITPMFDTTSAPEVPYRDFAAGRLGIVKPTFRRPVLYAAYRYIAGSGMNAAEQEALIQVWRADMHNKDFRTDDEIDDAVKTWVSRRADVVGKDEKLPDIYTERSYGGYDFFPNCTRNAFEVAAETLADRASAHGPSDPGVRNWVAGQDQVFQNCSSGKSSPDPAPPGSPAWLDKDRAYQMAAASFYSLDYNDARRRFAEIAQDTESPWAETADYLVGRTLIRQASLTKSADVARPLYEQAEQHLERFVSRSGKFSDSSQKMLNLVKYRLHPRERASELAKVLAFQGGNDNFRQDLIDYNWLLDKFESEVLEAEEARKKAAKAVEEAANAPSAPAPSTSEANALRPSAEPKKDGDLELNLYTDGGSWTFYIPADATDADAIAAAERAAGKALTEEQRSQVRSLRQSAYAGRFSDRASGYEGSYWGEEKLTPSMVPDFLRQDDLTDWLYTYQMSGAEAYLHSLEKFKAGGSELWLMTALSKAEPSSTQLSRLLEAADNISRTSPSYTTIAYHKARILLATEKQAEARKLIDEMLNAGDAIPLSARNAFIQLRLRLAETLDDFLAYSLRRAYAFDFSGEVSTIDDIIAEQKTYYDPEYNKDGREAYEAEIEAQYREQRLWQDRPMFDAETVEVFNQHFTTAALIDVEKHPGLPEYMRGRFALAAWTRAYLLDNFAQLLAITPEVIKYYPNLESQLTKITSAKTQAAMDRAALYFILKNPIVTPFLEDGIGRTDNEQEQWSIDDWWCEPYDMEYDDATNSEVEKAMPKRPAFLTPEQSKAAQAERRRLKEIGDAPKFLGARVIEWAKRTPLDRRVPEALYIMAEANGWNKYGCGNNEELRTELISILKKRYPSDPWTQKMIAEQAEQ